MDMIKRPKTYLKVLMPKQSELIDAINTHGNNTESTIGSQLIDLLNKYDYFDGTYKVAGPTTLIRVNPLSKKDSDNLYIARMHFTKNCMNESLSSYSSICIQLEAEGNPVGYMARSRKILCDPGTFILGGIKFDTVPIKN
jgi:hypothetical protein